jgi:hypothetical protein
MACRQEMTYDRSILEDLRLAEEAGMVFPEVAVEEVEAEVDELEALNAARLRKKCNELGVGPVGDKHKGGTAGSCGGRASQTRARVRKLAPSDGWQTAPAAVARRVVEVEDEQENAAEDEAVALEEDLSDEEADSVGPVK